MKTITKDPVCGMTVDEPTSLRSSYGDKEYLFCSEKCLERFRQHPQNYVDQESGAGSSAPADSVKQREKGRGTSWKDYIPLMVIVGFTLLAAVAKQVHYDTSMQDKWDWMTWMHDFMGFFLIVFSMFKFFNMEGFADGFQMYDLLAKPFRPYAYIYPFLELGLGLGYLAHWQPNFVYTATIVLMVFGSLGVFSALIKGLDLECACMGTVLKVPLSTVALVEDVGMAAMAGLMLLRVL